MPEAKLVDGDVGKEDDIHEKLGLSIFDADPLGAVLLVMPPRDLFNKV